MLRTWRSEQTLQRRRGTPRAEQVGAHRFAFYGRLSTKEHQHAETSWQWQLNCAADLIDGFGPIVAHFFDVGMTRRRAWAHRPQAARLLTAVGRRGMRVDAVVVGEYERAFSGRQVFHIATLLAEHGTGFWLPELHGPVDLQGPAHRWSRATRCGLPSASDGVVCRRVVRELDKYGRALRAQGDTEDETALIAYERALVRSVIGRRSGTPARGH